MVLSYDNQKIYASIPYYNSILVFKTLNFDISEEIELNLEYSANSLAASNDGHYLVIAIDFAKEVKIIDLRNENKLVYDRYFNEDDITGIKKITIANNKVYGIFRTRFSEADFVREIVNLEQINN